MADNLVIYNNLNQNISEIKQNMEIAAIYLLT